MSDAHTLHVEPMDDWVPVYVPVVDLPDEIALNVSLWYVEVGQSVIEGERIVELKFPGMLVEVYAPVEGRLVRINRQADHVIKSGDVLGWIERQ